MVEEQPINCFRWLITTMLLDWHIKLSWTCKPGCFFLERTH